MKCSSRAPRTWHAHVLLRSSCWRCLHFNQGTVCFLCSNSRTGQGTVPLCVRRTRRKQGTALSRERAWAPKPCWNPHTRLCLPLWLSPPPHPSHKCSSEAPGVTLSRVLSPPCSPLPCPPSVPQAQTRGRRGPSSQWAAAQLPCQAALQALLWGRQLQGTTCFRIKQSNIEQGGENSKFSHC